jgi:hypothetical protein
VNHKKYVKSVNHAMLEMYMKFVINARFVKSGKQEICVRLARIERVEMAETPESIGTIVSKDKIDVLQIGDAMNVSMPVMKITIGTGVVKSKDLVITESPLKDACITQTLKSTMTLNEILSTNEI